MGRSVRVSAQPKDLQPPWKGQGKGSQGSGNWRDRGARQGTEGYPRPGYPLWEGLKRALNSNAPWARGKVGGCQGITRWWWKNKVKRLKPAFKMERNINTGICVPFWPGSGFKSSITALGYTANYKKKATEDIECHKNDICALQRAQIILTESSKVSNCSQRQNCPFVLVSRHTSWLILNSPLPPTFFLPSFPAHLIKGCNISKKFK